MRCALPLLAATLALSACRGTVPDRDGPPVHEIAAILIGGRMILPSGETRDAATVVNFETDGAAQAEVYRLPIRGGETFLYRVEPGSYRLAPTRSLFGFYQPTIEVVVEGRSYRIPFPRQILRLDPFQVRPAKIATLGILEARVLPALPGRPPEISVRMDDSVDARRAVVQDAIHAMMDMSRPVEARESAISWSRALQNSLMEILAEDAQRSTDAPAE